MEMKNKMLALLLSLICCMSLLGGCGDSAGSSDQSLKEQSQGQEQQADQDTTDEGTGDKKAEAEKEPVSLGEFSMEDIYGESYTQEMFADYRLTMVNVFATWCSPCINEIPDLEILKNEMAEKEVNLVGIVLDAADGEGGADQEAIEKAKALAEQLGVTYPFLVPDAGYLNGLLLGVSAVPTTFFVDGEGRLVGGVYLGGHSLEDWRSIVEAELEGAAP